MMAYLSRPGAALILLLGMATAVQGAAAAEAARVVFVAGTVQSGARALAVGDAIQEGDEVSTGTQGYVYMKTVDNGLLILRPASRARIVRYHVDTVNPANTQVKLELLAGVARNVSGDAVKLARQNFRFNTPVAAIGVRGTDFTVSTDQETSRVTVISGAIVVSGFSGSCLPGGGGPCEHNASRELSAGQVGQMLQVRRGQAEPQLLGTGSQAPDAVAPPRTDEPLSKRGAGAVPAGDALLDPQKAENLLQQAASQVRPNGGAPTMPPTMPPAEHVVADPTPELPVVPDPVPQPPVVQSQLIWGRWQAVLGQPIQNNNVALAASGAEAVGRNSYYTVYRSKGEKFAPPVQGSVAFVLKQSEAVVSNSQTKVMSAAALENGSLSVDFDKARFATGFDLVSEAGRSKLQAVGSVTSSGMLEGDTQFYKPTNMDVKGALSKENGGSAAYVFSTRLDDKRTVNGVTYWGK